MEDERNSQRQGRRNAIRGKKKKYVLRVSQNQRSSQASEVNLMRDMIQTLSNLEIVQKKLQAEPVTQRYAQRETKERGPRNQRQYINQPQSRQNNRNSGNENHNRNNGHQQRNACAKYFNSSDIINASKYGIDEQIKKIKKIIMMEKPNIKALQIYASKQYPMIYFQYQDSAQGQKTYLIMREALKKITHLKQKRQVFSTIFERLFKPVIKKYYNLAVFAIQKGKQIKVNFTKNSIFDLEEGKEVMFYYMIGSKNQQINFVIFDKHLRSIEFNNQFIIYHLKNHPDQYKIFEEFKKSIFEDEQENRTAVDIMDNQEAESDQQYRPIFEETSLRQLETKFHKLIGKDLSDLENKIQQLGEEIESLAQTNSNDSQLLKLTDKQIQLNQNKDNFCQLRDKIIKEYERIYQRQKQVGKQFYKRSLKKMILVEKQLESGLPIVGKKKQIIQLLQKNNLLIIEGETGSGKSTQLPQILCEFYQLFDNPKALPVLVTQPRRLATRSLAERVAQQMGERVGGFVDYVASAGKGVSRDAKIIFKLDRLVLDQLTDDQILSNYSCLVIDEAHERTISIDVILGLIKSLLQKRKDFKIIVTSASMDIHLFQSYFKTKTLKVSGRMYPVEITYKDYAKYCEGHKYQVAKKIQKLIDEEILEDNSKMKKTFKGHLLCFCSGVDEINELVRVFTAKLNRNVFEIFALHGKVTPVEQKKVFTQSNKHKFIFASRIAETAITIDGVRVVIDPGQDIQLVYDQKYKVTSMKMKDITQSSAKQRAGRSGRTGPGHCFRLYSQQNFKKRNSNKLSEIQNSSLESVVLRLKSLKIHDVVQFPYISPPSKDGLIKSLQILKLIGALDKKNQTVTKIGKLLIKMPIQPFLARAVIEGILFQRVFLTTKDKYMKKMLPQEKKKILNQNISIAIIQILTMVVNFSNLFFVLVNDRQNCDRNKYFEFSDQEGDFFFLQNIYKKYKTLNQINVPDKSRGKRNYNSQLNTWISKNYLNRKALKQVEDLIKEISKIVDEFEIVDKQYVDQMDNVKSKILECKSYRQVILSCLITTFSPNLCKYSGNPSIGYTIVGEQRPIQIYGTSNISLLGVSPNWIICYDLYTNELGTLYCKLAHSLTYSFMEKHIDKDIWRQYKIDNIEKNNPFYKEIVYNLPTKILQQVRFDYKKEDDKKFQFLRSAFPIISEQKNKVTFFLLIKEKQFLRLFKQQDLQPYKQFSKEIDIYISKLQDTLNQEFRHNYIGSIFVNLDKGFKVKDIEFNNKEFCFEIISQLEIIDVIAEDCLIYGKCIVEDINRDYSNKYQRKSNLNQSPISNKKKIKVFIIEEENRRQFMYYLAILIHSNPAYSIQFKQTLVDKRRKVPQTKIVLHFFAGTSDKDNLLMSYDISQNKNLAIQMLELMKQGILKKRQLERRNFRCKISQRGLKITRAGNGINIFNCHYDEYQIAEELFQMDKNKFFDHTFKFPKFIKKFRSPDITMASKNNQVWKEQIQVLLEKANIKKDNLIINIRGYYKPDKNVKLNGIQKTFRVDMTADITTLDNSLLSKLKTRYDGQQRILGCQKMHVRAYYDQVIAVPAGKAFDALDEEYKYNLGILKESYPLLSFSVVRKIVRNKQKVLIIARSPNRQDFIQPLRLINNLFTPKLMKLQFSQFRFLDKLKAGQNILDQLEAEYQYKIYFGFQKFNNCLKVYCQDNQLKDIQQKLKARIKKFNSYSEFISYKGKNLHKVRQILDQKIKDLPKNNQLTYQINFQKRNVYVTSDLATFESVKNDLLKLIQSDKKQCGICADVMSNPYRFLNCQCQFCWLCLADHFRAFRNSPDEESLVCPSQNCQKPISVHDVKTILSEQQFNKLCDIKISNFVQKHDYKYLPCKYCQHIFDREEAEKEGEVSCQVCGKFQCLKCNQSHPGYTCDQWKNKDDLKGHLKQMGIKQCPKCKTGIQKNGGCNHIQCPQCKIHICWNCLQTFTVSSKCYDHMAKVCGGIFNPDTQ